MEDANNNLRDFKLAIEYKHLINHCPGGVYLIPSFEDIRTLEGVIFVRRGLFRNGIFRFRVSLPASYNTKNSHPLVTFSPPIFNPLVDSETGILDLKLEESLKEWNPERHHLGNVLTFVKKIFYMKSFQNYQSVPNEKARHLLSTDKETYLQMVSECVEDSLKRVHENPPNSNIVFTEPKPCHELVKTQIWLRLESESGNGASDSGHGNVASTLPADTSLDLSREEDALAARESVSAVLRSED